MTEPRHEHELLLCIARKSLDERVVDRLRQLAQKEIAWDYITKTANEQGLLPLLYAHSKAHISDLVPRQILEELRIAFFENSQRNLSLVQELLSIVQLLKSNGIKSLNFKGPVLGSLAYGDFALRRAGDLDILIEKQNFVTVKELLHSGGYRMEPDLSPVQQESHLKFHCEIQFFNRQKDTVIDLHWGLAPKNFPLDLRAEDLLNRSRQISIAGYNIETFSHEDLLLYLCMHGAKHYWSRLEWIGSIAEIIRSSDTLDWDVVVGRASEAKITIILNLSLLLARDLLGVELPLAAQQSLKQNQNLEGIAQRIMAELPRANAAYPTQWEMFRFNLLVMDRKLDAARALTLSMLSPTISDWQVVSLPHPLYPLYYVLRPIRLFGKYSAQFTQRRQGS